ncbi:unnamed protein product [Zymoseptoria tritici ST99CH_3D7]|uniref:Very-long-chain (3R)-3-hydroxyacyl-CoA dehydratase n=1 Tax=Zymoseptoria tritici (strain ST99CH_3D7) TaxID=1276538 RepID=A0A1X7RJA9_ZYMT9|nr:unnamed protein product [Zymoseptoria tritici ST99CH_3D7]
MNRPADSQQLPKGQATRSAKKSSPAKTGYLILYNALSAVLWAVVLTRTLQTTATKGYKSTYLEVGEWTKWTQTLAGLEVLHAATGLVRAPLLTTLMQVASRYLLVWLIVEPFPHTTALSSPAYSSMLVAWSVTEVIRYSYFAVTLTTGGVPGWMLWLRYNTFFVLYPLGIGSDLVDLRAWFLCAVHAYDGAEEEGNACREDEDEVNGRSFNSPGLCCIRIEHPR